MKEAHGESRDTHRDCSARKEEEHMKNQTMNKSQSNKLILIYLSQTHSEIMLFKDI
jgi:hypothetical protein